MDRPLSHRNDDDESSRLVDSVLHASIKGANTPAKAPHASLKAAKYAVGMVALLMVVVTWVGTGELTQVLADTHGYYEPVFLIWLCHCTLALLTPGVLCMYSRQRSREGASDVPLLAYIASVVRRNFGSLRRAARLGVSLAFMYLAINIVYFLGDTLLPASVASSVGQGQCAFAYIFSLLILHETLRASRVVAVGLCVCGSVVILLSALGVRFVAGSDDDTSGYDKGHGVEGVALMFGFCICWGLYEVLYDKYAEAESTVDVLAILAVYGWVHILLLWPCVVAANHLGFETFEWPSMEVLPILLCYLLDSFLFNCAFNLAIALTSPVVVSVASVTVVPATFLVDGVLRGDVQPILSYLGGVAILCGFVCLNFATWREKLVEARRAQHKRQEQARQDARWDNAPRAPLLSSPTPGVAAAVV